MELTDVLAEVRADLLDEDGGEPSDSIPMLAAAGPECFALAAVTVDGDRAETEEAELEFTLQSVVKPWIYALALGDHGAALHDRIGVEPTGEPFDALVLDHETGRPPNPMVNAGALMACSLVSGTDAEARARRVLEVCSAAAGRELRIDDDVAAMELEHADRNRALGYLMRDGGGLEGEVEEAVEVLARLSAVVVTVGDLAAMGATLADWGRNPETGERVLDADDVTEVVSVMATCGMYDGAGTWAHRVGMPAKSGVSGALMAVAPGRMGLGSYSAPLDPRGNSVRGVAASEQLSARLGLHRFAQPPS